MSPPCGHIAKLSNTAVILLHFYWTVIILISACDCLTILFLMCKSSEAVLHLERNVRTSAHVFSFSPGCHFLSLSSSGDGSWAGSSSGSPAAEFEAKKTANESIIQNFNQIPELITNVRGFSTWGLSFCTRLIPPEPYTTVFSGMTSHVLTWQQAPTMQPLVRITFLPRSAGRKKDAKRQSVVQKHWD